MANNTCAIPPELYQGDNTTKDFSFAFQYIKKEDVVVYLWDEPTKTYIPCTDVGTQAGCNLIPQETEYYFKSDVEVTFCKAPGLPPEDRWDGFANVIIGRSVDVCAMVAYYYPGTSIRAQDLNNNFTQVLLAIQDTESRLYRALVELQIEVDQIVGIIKEDDMQDEPYPIWDDERIGTAAADKRYFSTYVQEDTPDPNYHHEVGKTWLQNDKDLTVSIWDGDSWVGVASGGTFTSQPTTIYVDSVNGIDTNDGHRIINPMKTIKAAVAQCNTVTSAITTNVVAATYDNEKGIASFTTNAAHGCFVGTPLTLTQQIWECDNGQLLFPEAGDPVRYVSKVMSTTSFEVQMEPSSKVHTYVSGGTVTGKAGFLGDGWLIACAAGVYEEIAPITIEARNLSIVGRTLRSTFIHPTSATELETLFLVDSGFYLNNFTIAGIKASGPRGGSTIDSDPTTGLPTNQGWVAAFRPGCVIRKSPYIQNCTNFADSEIDNDNFDPNTLKGEGGDASSAPTGGGILCDGFTPSTASPLRSFVVDAFTQIALDGPGILATNNSYAQLVSFFGTFCFYHAKALNGAQLNLSNCTTDFGAYGLIADGRSPSPVITGTVSGNYPAGNPDPTNKVEITVTGLSAKSTYKTNQPGGTQLVTIGSQTYMILSATEVNNNSCTIKVLNPNINNRILDDGLIDAINSGASAEFRLQSYISTGGHTFEFSGSGTDYSAHPDYGGQADESKQVQELGGTGTNGAFNGGKVWLSSTDEEGVFKVGDTFQVNQKTGFVTFDPSAVATIVVSDPTPDLGGDLDVNGYKILGDRNGANGDIKLETNLSSSVDIQTGVVNIGDDSDNPNIELNASDGSANFVSNGVDIQETALSSANGGNLYFRIGNLTVGNNPHLRLQTRNVSNQISYSDIGLDGNIKTLVSGGQEASTLRLGVGSSANNILNSSIGVDYDGNFAVGLQNDGSSPILMTANGKVSAKSWLQSDTGFLGPNGRLTLSGNPYLSTNAKLLPIDFVNGDGVSANFKRMQIQSNGNVVIGGFAGDSGIGNDVTDFNISLNANGKITANGPISGPDWNVDIAQNNYYIQPAFFSMHTDGTTPNSSVLSVYQGGGKNTTFRVQSNGTVQISGTPTNNPDIQLDANGTISAINTAIQPISSERRLKENIVAIDADAAWETVKSTPYYAYNNVHVLTKKDQSVHSTTECSRPVYTQHSSQH